jgi:hypothetical protein
VAMTTLPHPVASGQFFDITLIPIIPGQIKRYERNQLYAKSIC